MEEFNRDQPRGASYPAVYFIREDLKREKVSLLEDMREISLNYWGGTDPIMDDLLREVTARVEEINEILRKVNTGVYVAPEDDV